MLIAQIIRISIVGTLMFIIFRLCRYFSTTNTQNYEHITPDQNKNIQIPMFYTRLQISKSTAEEIISGLKIIMIIYTIWEAVMLKRNIEYHNRTQTFIYDLERSIQIPK